MSFLFRKLTFEYHSGSETYTGRVFVIDRSNKSIFIQETDIAAADHLQLLKADHHQPISETPFEWWADSSCYCILAESL